MKKMSSENKNDIFKALSVFIQLGVSMVMCILISFFIGKIIDRYLGTTPIFLLIFIFIGIISAFRNMCYLVKNIYKNRGDE